VHNSYVSNIHFGGFAGQGPLYLKVIIFHEASPSWMALAYISLADDQGISLLPPAFREAAIQRSRARSIFDLEACNFAN
jgi:hypothetical protein